jgi:hypothetical protein
MDNVPDLPLHQSRSSADRGLKNCAESPHPALCGFNECSLSANLLRFPKRRTPWLTT